MASPAEIQELLIDTLNLLEWRLRRLEFALTGNIDNERSKEQAPSTETPVLARVKKLEHSLQQLSIKSDVVSDLIKLRMALTSLAEYMS